MLSSAPSYNNPYNTNSIEYRYGQSSSHVLYGTMGFSYLETIDLQTDIITRTNYRRDFPFIGMPSSTQVWYKQRTPDHLVSEATKDYGVNYPNGVNKVIHTFESKSRAYSYDFDLTAGLRGALIAQEITTNTYTNEGYPKVQIAYSCYGDSPDCELGGWQKRLQTTNTYLPDDLTNWITARLKRVTVNHTVAGEPSISRTTEFKYNLTTGILEAEIIEPDLVVNSSKYLKKRYFHNSYGNKIGETICNSMSDCALSPGSDPFVLNQLHRTSSFIYDADNRYLVKTINGYNQVTSEVLQRNELGQPTRTKDIVGNIGEKTYGTFGVDYFSKSASGSWARSIKRLCQDAAIDCPQNGVVRVEKTTADGGRVYEYADSLGRVIKTSKRGFGNYDLVSETAYDAKGRIAYTTLPYKSDQSIVYKNFND
ncbi:MAG: hypothetical protein Q9M92_14985 [Enterobacterales bacterium]|nr:hypothetical protein [Enterobacterales bacterium]